MKRAYQTLTKVQAQRSFDVDARRDSLTRVKTASEHARALVAHWVDIAGDRLAPDKSDLEPAKLKAALPSMLIYEHFFCPDEVVFRLFGTGLHSAFHADLTGKNYLDYVPFEDRASTALRLRMLIEQPCGLLTRLLGPAGRGVSGIYEAIGLPLCDGAGNIRYTIHLSELVERGVRPKSGTERKLVIQGADYFDIGAGLPDIGPPI